MLLNDDDADASAGGYSNVADGGDGGSRPRESIFFTVSDKSLSSFTLLGDTSMKDVDLFLQSYSCVSESGGSHGERDESSVALVYPRADVLVATWQFTLRAILMFSSPSGVLL